MFGSYVIKNNDQSNYQNVSHNEDNFYRDLEYKVFLSVPDKLKISYNQIKSMLLTKKLKENTKKNSEITQHIEYCNCNNGKIVSSSSRD